MVDRINVNLPARAFDETERFYAGLGFVRTHRDDGWMILARGSLEIEFFAHPELDPGDSWFSACVRVADVDALHAAWSRAGPPAKGIPRMTAPRDEPYGFRAFALVDPNGSLLRCLSPLGGPPAASDEARSTA